MSESEDLIEFRIYETANTDFISQEFIEEINNDSLNFFNEMGINAKILPPPQLGGGLSLSLLMQILKSIISLIQIESVKIVDDAAPRFKIYLYFNQSYDSETIWKWNGTIDHKVKQLIIQAWQLAEYLKKTYKGYQFEFEIDFRVPKFHYRLKMNLPYNQLNKVSTGFLINFVTNLQLKGYINEYIYYYPSVFLIGQNIEYTTNDNRIVKHNIFYYLKLSKTKQFSCKNIGILEKNCPKGIMISPVACIKNK